MILFGYVVGIGVDIGENDVLKLSFQIATPASLQGGSGGSKGSSSSSSSSESSTYIINTVECNSVDTGLNLINSHISKNLNLSHCKVIVFSEALAYQGISEYLYTLVNKIDLRPDCNVIVSRCSSEYFLQSTKPVFEKLASSYYEVTYSSSQYTGYVANLKLEDFFNSMSDTDSEAYAILRRGNN